MGTWRAWFLDLMPKKKLVQAYKRRILSFVLHLGGYGASNDGEGGDLVASMDV